MTLYFSKLTPVLWRIFGVILGKRRNIIVLVLLTQLPWLPSCSTTRSSTDYHRYAQDLTRVPDDIPDTAQNVLLYSNRITDLQKHVFLNLTQCTFLSLRDNTIWTIEKGAFEGLVNLRTLRLEKNHLNLLESGMFTGLESLVTLRLESNRITMVLSGAVADLPNLSHVDLSDNMINVIESGAFSGLPSLYEIALINNRITHIDKEVLSGLPRPLNLQLASNPMDCTPENMCWMRKEYRVGAIRWDDEPACANDRNIVVSRKWDYWNCKEGILEVVLISLSVPVTLVACFICCCYLCTRKNRARMRRQRAAAEADSTPDIRSTRRMRGDVSRTPEANRSSQPLPPRGATVQSNTDSTGGNQNAPFLNNSSQNIPSLNNPSQNVPSAPSAPSQVHIPPEPDFSEAPPAYEELETPPPDYFSFQFEYKPVT